MQSKPVTFADVMQLQSPKQTERTSKKLHFKGVASVFMQEENSLDLGDEYARELVKECLQKSGNPPNYLTYADQYALELKKHQQREAATLKQKPKQVFESESSSDCETRHCSIVRA